MVKFKYAKQSDKPKHTLLKNLVKSVIPKKLGRPRRTKNIKEGKSGKSAKLMIDEIKKAKLRLKMK